MNENTEIVPENLLEERPREITPEEKTKIIGANILHFLNKPGTSPPKNPESLQVHKAWSECCDFCMSLMSGDTFCVSGQLGAAIAAANKASNDGAKEEFTPEQFKINRAADKRKARADAKKSEAGRKKPTQKRTKK